MNLKKFLVICGLVVFGLFVIYYLNLLVNLLLGPILVRPYSNLVDSMYTYLLAVTSSPLLASLSTCFIIIAAAICLDRMFFPLQTKVINNYNIFKNDNIDSDSAFSDIYKDPTIGLKDKILFFQIHLIYCLQFPFLYLASKVSAILGLLMFNTGLLLLNYLLLVPVAILELIKYPLIKLFSPLGLNVKQLSFLFNVSDIGTGSQNIHTRSFEDSVIQCAKELKEKHGTPLNELDKEFKDYISSLTDQQKQMIAPYLRLDGYQAGEWVSWQDSKTGLTLTQAINLVLTAAREKNTDIALLKSILLVRFEESNRKCGTGMLNRIIYALSSLEAKNNFTVEVNSQVYAKIPIITEEFLRSYKSKKSKKFKILKDHFNDFYDGGGIDPEVKDSIDKSIEEAKQFVFNELYIHYYNLYGKDIEGVGRGPIRQKLKELITNGDIIEAIIRVIDEIETTAEPSTFFEKVQVMFRGYPTFSAA